MGGWAMSHFTHKRDVSLNRICFKLFIFLHFLLATCPVVYYTCPTLTASWENSVKFVNSVPNPLPGAEGKA